ncbi:hypothetical protein PV325_000299 [Microctonus aethiopoides]|uniref:EGF-like domain-containing protein n=1 Tax=Microctonus aethiopoides TaxID=144406 RepID=A0AA39FPQ4_9HYME|nr:hypothetical protein PV325_000299 [Microctonus aethiopoides]KAK0173316.1 hypothetical protein PV328_006531 [Microctonus aethiopoides]
MNQTTVVIFVILGLIKSGLSIDKQIQESKSTTEISWPNTESDNLYLDNLAESTPTSASSETLECPSTNIVRVKYKCPGRENSWTDCVKSHCCPGYNFINGQCISANINPCTLNLCEQRCEYILQKVVCTCWDGYRFTPTSNDNDERDNKLMCIDIDECKENIHNCEQICVNIPGSFICDCKNGFTLDIGNKTCVEITDELNLNDNKCATNCHEVLSLKNKIMTLENKLLSLENSVASLMNSGVKLSGQFRTSNPPSSHDELHFASAAYSDESTSDDSHSILDSFVQTGVGYCKCQRGPIGPPGAPGATGPKGAMGERGSRGAKGATGSLDFLLLLLADVRHDITIMQERIFPGEILPKFDFDTVLKKQRSIIVETKNEANVHRDDIGKFEGSKLFSVSDSTSPEEGFVEYSGDEWDHHEE